MTEIDPIYRSSGTQSGHDLLRTSWIGREHHVAEDILQSLGDSPSFQKYVTLSLDSLRPDTIDTTDNSLLWDYVVSGQSALDMSLNSTIWDSFTQGHYVHPSMSLKVEETILTAELKVRTLLFSLLHHHRGYGYTIESLAEKFMRTGSLKTDESLTDRLTAAVPVQNMKFFLRLSNGENFSPRLTRAADIIYWREDEWLEQLEGNTLLSAADRSFLIREIQSRRQPLVQVELDLDQQTPWEALPNWGSRIRSLRSMPYAKIIELARGLYCSPSCCAYHGEVSKQKALGELIAPVDTELVTKELIDSYSTWKESRINAGERFSVLIPAQADETTIIGILDKLAQYGIDSDELKQNFSLVSADLCPTPLLRIYAELRERNMLEISNITSSNVFNWGDPREQKFQFIFTDHFVDLFPSTGEMSQAKVIESLVSALAPGGKLLLTARCGTDGNILTKSEVMAGFYSRCNESIRKLTDELKLADETKGTEYDGTYNSLFPTKQALARGIYALIAYLGLRDVNPFRTIEDLNDILIQITSRAGATRFQVTPMEGKINKVSMKVMKES